MLQPHELDPAKIATALRVRADEHAAASSGQPTMLPYTAADAAMDEAFAKLLEQAAPQPIAGYTEKWRGIHKLKEEMHELGQVLAKLEAFPSGHHPGHGDLMPMLIAEMGDLQAAFDFFADSNNLDPTAIEERCAEKHQLFGFSYRMTGVLVPVAMADGSMPLPLAERPKISIAKLDDLEHGWCDPDDPAIAKLVAFYKATMTPEALERDATEAEAAS